MKVTFICSYFKMIIMFEIIFKQFVLFISLKLYVK